MSKHTPGPWVTREIGPSKNFIIEDANQESICATFQKNNAANAALIAAAPDLLAALKDFSVAFTRGDGDCTPAQFRAKHAARAAIAKAQGGAA